MPRLLIVGRPCGELAAAAAMATARGAEVRLRARFDDAFKELCQGNGADLLLIDVEQDVAAVVTALWRQRISLPVVAFGIDVTPARAVAAIKAGAVEFIPVPPDADIIAALLESVAAEPRAFLCADPRMTEVMDLARRFAPADASVLITGESGTGKEVVARFVHRASRRAKGPFISVNCAAIPDNLLESELFGHEKGAFTGALSRRIGKFEEANGGTLLLDEISEMDIRLQAKLLRAIQEREIDRVGGAQPVPVDLRIIATSNRDLERAATAGQFREDLYFRLNVVALQLPPLRERPADIAVLAEHFIDKYAQANGMKVKGLSVEARAMLVGHVWRGNVRELENCMHRAVLLARDGRVGADSILLRAGPAAVVAKAPPMAPAPAANVPASTPGAAAQDRAVTGLVGRTVDDLERDLIVQTLRHTAGNRTHAATMLGISIRTLRNKLKEYAERTAGPAAA